jgi:hypothetical protein
MSVTSQFVKAFDPADEAHVTWFKVMTDTAEAFADPAKAVDIVALIRTNPMKVHIKEQDALDWFHIHFVLCAVYAKAVLKGQAFIPKSSSNLS